MSARLIDRDQFQTQNLEREYVVFLGLRVDGVEGLQTVGALPIRILAGVHAPSMADPPGFADPPAWTLQDVAPPYASIENLSAPA